MVYVFLAQGFEEIEAVTVVDVLRRGGVCAKTVSISGEKAVCGSHGISIMADLLFEDADFSDGRMIVLPGGMPGALNLMAHKGLLDLINSYAQDKKYLAAICAAPMVLGKIGLLAGRKATIYPGMEEKIKGAELSASRVTKDGNIITSKGPGTAMEFSLALLELLSGKIEKEELAESMVFS